MREQNLLNARQPANANRRVLGGRNFLCQTVEIILVMKNKYKAVVKTFLQGCLVGAIIMLFTVWIPYFVKHRRQIIENPKSQNRYYETSKYPKK